MKIYCEIYEGGGYRKREHATVISMCVALLDQCLERSLSPERLWKLEIFIDPPQSVTDFERSMKDGDDGGTFFGSKPVWRTKMGKDLLLQEILHGFRQSGI